MTISTVEEFEEATAFERYALELVPLRATHSTRVDRSFPQAQGPATVYGAFVHLYASDDLTGPREKAVIDRLLPLLVGAAWKVLDLTVELAGPAPMRRSTGS